MNRKLHRPDNALRRCAAWMALLLYLVAFSPAGIGFAITFASLDENHQVNLQAGESGVRLVLHHQSNGPTHHHGMVARTLSLFAQPPSTAQPDHVLQFSAADSVANPRQVATAPTANASAQPIIPTISSFRPIVQTPAALLPHRQVPDHPAEPASRRSTVLLI